MIKKLLPFMMFGFMTLTQAEAAQFQFQNIRVGGVGCPSETTQIIFAPDQSSASLIFNQFESRVPQVATSPKVNRNISTLNCNIFLDIKIPQGVKLESLDIGYDMRGLATFDRGVSGSFKSFLVSKAGLGLPPSRDIELLQEKTWSQTFAAQEEDFVIQTSKRLLMPTQCSPGNGADVVTLRLQNTLSSQILAGFENTSAQGMIIMDSSDFRGGLTLKANVATCSSNPGRPNPPGRNCRVVIVNGRTTQVCR